jgi:heptaprenyl diphosphate synthase
MKGISGRRGKRRPFSLAEELERVREIVLRNLEQTVPEIRMPLTEMVRSRAKLLRPTFVILSAALGSYDSRKITHIAAAVEMFHLASLIHDDIVDDARTRRGKPAVHVEAGRKNAVLMGDYLFSRSFLLVAEYASVENQRRMSWVISRICESEILETSSRFAPGHSVRRYLRRIAGKTAALFSLSCHVGASEARCPTAVQGRLRRAGYDIGMGFQIIDDILDLTASEASIGKPSGNDLREGVFTLPVICALNNDEGELYHTLQNAPYSPDRISAIVHLTDSLGGISLARETARLYTQRAVREIERLPDGRARDELESLSRQLLVREY